MQNKLEELFRQYRIVFWDDADGEFQDCLAEMTIDGVKVIRPDQIGQLKTKVMLEIDEPRQKFLVYSGNPVPQAEDDWLLDIRLYSYQFSADRATILLDELGLMNHHLRDYLNSRKKFFASKSRIEGLMKMIDANDSAVELDRKMLAVVTKAEYDELFEILRCVYKGLADCDGGLDAEFDIWQQVQKLELEEAFWGFVKTAFGYAEEKPSLKNLLIRLMVSDMAFAMGVALPGCFNHFVLSRQSNAAVCLGQWRDNNSKSESYDKLSRTVAGLLKIEEFLADARLEDLCGVVTFLDGEKIIARTLRDRVIQTADTINAEEIKQIAQRRQDMHWANNMLGSKIGVPRKALHAVYEAIITAADFFDLKNSKVDGFDFENAQQMYKAYTGELYKFDKLYRLFCEYADVAEAEGWGLLKDLQEKIEAVYRNWYLDDLAMQWGKLIEPETWGIDGVVNQYDFYKHFIEPIAGKTVSRGKVTGFVIISDAFRYEAAEELTAELNGKYRFVAELKSMLGVLPSYTSLGMASLLPHEKLQYGEKGEFLVNGKPSGSFQQRAGILEQYGGIAVKADDLLAMKKEDGRTFVRGKDIVYIYHNTVDAIGDSLATEEKAFGAVRNAISELGDLVRYIVNNLNGSQIFVTADHGFLYTKTKPNETDKNNSSNKPENAVKVKKRFIIGNDLQEVNDSYLGKFSITAGVDVDSDMGFVLPIGLSLFNFVGGSRFFHGGMSLQETVIPVILAGRVKGKKAELTRERKVLVQVLGTSHKITTSSHRFELLQTEAVSERVKPITLKVAVFDEDNEITNIESISFDSSSDNMAERTRWATLTLKNSQYDKNKVYYLVLRDSEDNTEKQRVEVKVDRAFINDF
ncbi:MAG: BREX-1 system phosphatase PglZ type A [Phycisphaerae bacterium]|nr:BREX-1 system phosphatase PglZ type A [Phycisphaerae bacterium]